MNIANTVRIDPTRRSGTELRVVGDRVSRLWNAANYLCRQRFIAKEGVPTGSSLQELMKGTPEYRQLPSDVAQETLNKLSEAWKSYFKLRAKWSEAPNKNQKPGLPKYRKDRKSGKRPFDLIPVKHPRSSIRAATPSTPRISPSSCQATAGPDTSPSTGSASSSLIVDGSDISARWGARK